MWSQATSGTTGFIEVANGNSKIVPWINLETIKDGVPLQKMKPACVPVLRIIAILDFMVSVRTTVPCFLRL